MISLYHAYLPKSVVRIVTLIEFTGAIYRGLCSAQIFLTHIEECTYEYNTNRVLPVFRHARECERQRKLKDKEEVRSHSKRSRDGVGKSGSLAERCGLRS